MSNKTCPHCKAEGEMRGDIEIVYECGSYLYVGGSVVRTECCLRRESEKLKSDNERMRSWLKTLAAIIQKDDNLISMEEALILSKAVAAGNGEEII